ncbi:MAG TPA: DUF885 family protein, partial [Pyrinomonadaceae bacterium]|nr:DUF885 family protein [Pyrinomonadaceae bacterium]
MLSKILAFALIFTFSAATILADMTKETADQQFEKLARAYIEELLVLNPEWATQLGDHRFDNRLNDYSRAGIAKNREFNERFLKQLKAISFDKLSKVNNVDARIMRDNLEYNIFQIDVLREHEWNPLYYNPGTAINNLTSRDFAPLTERLANVKARLLLIPNVVAAAKANLKNPPRVHTETAIAQNTGVIGLIRDDLEMFVKDAPEMREAITAAQKTAISALEDYGKWLKDDLLPRSTGDFRIGDAKYRQKLRFALESDLPKEELLKRAEADLRATQETMYTVAMSLYPKLFPNGNEAAKTSETTGKKFVIKSVLNKLAQSRPTNETIVGQANKDVIETTEFVHRHNLITVPTEPVEVIVMPEFARGSSFAYFDSAGTLEKKNETFYAISPTPKDWTPQRAESFFREYN